MPDKKTLDYYVAELRRVEKSRQADTEKEVEKIYKNILKELNHFLADEYANYSDSNGKLSVGVLNLRARYAKFLQEVDKHLNTVTPDMSAEIKKTVECTYKSVYKGMVKAVEDSTDNAELHERFKDLNLRPEIIKNAVENPISGLTLPDTLEKHRQEIIYGIKQQINIGLMTGERYDTMAKNINKAVFGAAGVGGLYGKSKNIVRTEVHRVQESGLADSAKDIMQGLEGSGLVEVAIWRTMKDERVRPQIRVKNARGKWKTYRSRSGADHQKLEGKAIVVGDKFEVESGVFAECPGKSGTARNDCNCRCFLEYKLVDIEEAARLTGKSIAEIRKIAGITEQTNTPAETTSTLQDNINKYHDEYVPVKTIEEAEEYAGRFIGDGYSPTFKNKAIYKGISVENANEINKTIYALYENIDMPKLNGIKVISPTSAQGKKVFKDGADAIAAYNPTEQGIFINKDLLKSQKAFESHIKKADEAWNTVMDNIDSLTGSQKELALIYKNAGRQLVDNSLQGAITHEVGHHIQWQVLDTKLNNSIGKDMSKYAPKISGYANASKSEYLAESFSAYIKGEIDKLDKDYVSFLDKKLIDKSVKSGIIKVPLNVRLNLFGKQEDYSKQTTKGLLSGIKKDLHQIEIHKHKIEHPEEYIRDYDGRNKQYKQGIVKYWEKEIKNFENQVKLRKNELKKRGEYNE